MIQNILVYIIIAATLAYVIFSTVNNLRVKKEGHCGGCDGCSVKNEFHKALENKRNNTHAANTKEVNSYSLYNSLQNGNISIQKSSAEK